MIDKNLQELLKLVNTLKDNLTILSSYSLSNEERNHILSDCNYLVILISRSFKQ